MLLTLSTIGNEAEVACSEIYTELRRPEASGCANERVLYGNIAGYVTMSQRIDGIQDISDGLYIDDVDAHWWEGSRVPI
jgi:hypothetical protein